jgi:hypothetical protein
MSIDDKMGAEGDAIYAALMQAHEGLSEDQSHRLNARLVLMLANEVGDGQRVRSLIAAARALTED